MRIAAIDLGTNTFHLIIVDSHSKKISILYKTQKPIKLGENITLDTRIIPSAFDRGIECLIEFKALLKNFQVEKIRAVATSAVRSASNGLEFIEVAFQKTGIEIEVIDGNEEANLIYEGVKASGVITEKSLIMDIGGGSTEFIFCDQQQFYWKKSFEIGAARLLQQFFKSDPISDNELITILEHLKSTVGELIEFNKTFQCAQLIGSAGAFETFSLMTNPLFDIENEPKGNIDIDSYRALSRKLIQSTHDQRSRMKNLIPLRVDMIVMACVITDFVIQNLNLNQLKFSTYDLKIGVLNSIDKC